MHIQFLLYVIWNLHIHVYISAIVLHMISLIVQTSTFLMLIHAPSPAILSYCFKQYLYMNKQRYYIQIQILSYTDG